MEARAIAKNVKIAPRKARLVIDLVRGKSVIEADIILANMNKEAARLIRKVLTSATANAENNLGLKKEDLYKNDKDIEDLKYLSKKDRKEVKGLLRLLQDFKKGR